MARPKEFERDAALRGAIDVFSDHGFEGATTEGLVGAMGISRQSMYDTFGDKRHLYLECLQRYTADSIGEQIRALNLTASPVAGIAALLDHAIAAALADPRCLGVGAIAEFGRSDAEVATIGDVASRAILSALSRRIGEGKAAGEIPDEVDTPAAADFLLATLSGIKLAARAGASAGHLRGIARMALRSLR